MRRVIVLGATGSVGTSTLSVLRDNPADFVVAGLASRRPGEAALALAREFPEAAVAIAEAEPGFVERLRGTGWRGVFFSGADAAERLVGEIPSEVCVAAMGGAVGLRPTFAAARAGLRIVLANKEVLVAAGGLFLRVAAEHGAVVLPADSEHAALWQCLEGRDRAGLERLIITASGGPFRTWSRERMAGATVAEAVRHPVWSMGRKISVDSATLANKVLELFEAEHLFGLPFGAMRVLVHPQSVVHGMVEFRDGSIIAHMGVCDMRQPIMYMLYYPEVRDGGFGRVDLAKAGRLDFEEPDGERFPLFGAGLRAGVMGGCAPVVFNAANEMAVELFLGERISFGGIGLIVEGALERFASSRPCSSLEETIALHDEVCATIKAAKRT